jgi:hypothetical protein
MQAFKLDPANRRKLLIAVIAIFLLYPFISNLLPLFAKRPSWEEIAKTIHEVNRTMMPKTLQDGTILLEVRPDKPWEFTYRYTVDEETAETARNPETREAFATLMRQQHERIYRESETSSMQQIRRLRITCIHRYEDVKAGTVLELRVEPRVLEGK